MKVGDFLPDIVQKDTQLVQGNQWLNKLYDMGFTGFMKAQYGSNVESAAQYYGIEQLYFDWLRQAYAYRRMFIQDLYLLAFDCSEIRTPLLHLKKEIFRKGFDEWHPKFVVRCDKCDMDFQDEEEAKDHKKHGLRRPNRDQVKEFDRKWRMNCNIFGQDLESVLNSIEDDLNIVDDAYIHLNKQYKNIHGKMHTQLLEIRRIHPALIEYDLDKNGLPKNSHWFCPFHRDDIQIQPGNCKVEECGTVMSPALYVYNHRGGRVYMMEDELIHVSKFSPHETYGYSPILTLMQKVLTISGMDRFLYRYFFERKTPTQMILTNTDDPQSLEMERARMESKMMEDPTYTPWIAVSNRTGRGKTDVVKLFHTLHEMDYLNVRNEIRDRIAGIYGVPQMFYNVMEGVGGLSGQSVSGDTPIWVRRDDKFIDLIPIESLHKSTAYEYNNFPKDLEVFSAAGWTKPVHVWKHASREEKTLAIEIGGGYVETTVDHSVMKNGIATKSSDLKIGDEIDCVIESLSSNDYNSITPDFAWYLGFYAAEGNLTKHRVCVSNNDKVLLAKASSILEATFNKKAEVWFRKTGRKEQGRVEVYGNEISSYIKSLSYYSYNLAEYEGKRKYSRSDKTIRKVPTQVLNGTKDIKKAYLDGFLVGDGTIEGNGSIRGYSTSLTLVAGIEHLMTELGFKVNCEFRLYKEKNKNWNNNWRLTAGKNDRRNKQNEIKRIIEVDAPEYVYDIETESHTFVGGIGKIVLHNTQQLKMMANVVASDQRMFNEKIIPAILKNIGITDWEIKLRTPEEKIEGETLQLAQQKVAIATAMRQMGYDIKLKPGAWDIDTMDFSFSGKALSLQEQQQMMMGAAGGMGGPMGGGMVPPGAGGPGGATPQVDEQGNVVGGGEQGGGAPGGGPLRGDEEKKSLHIGKDDDDKKNLKRVNPKKHRLEEQLYDVKTPEEEDEEEKDNDEEEAWG